MSAHGNFFVLDGPLAPAPSALQTRSAHLRGFSALVCRLGQSPARMLDRVGIDPKAAVSDDCYVDCPSLVELIGRCSTDLNQPLFGLTLAQQHSTHVLGTVASLCRAAPDFRTAIENLCEFLPVAHSPQCQLDYVAGAQASELRLNSRSEFEFMDQMMYGGLFTNVVFLQELGAGEFAPKYITTRYRPSGGVREELEKTLGCPIRTAAEHDAIGFASGILEKPLLSADRLVFRLLGEYLDRVRSEQRHALIDRVKDYIRGSLSSHCSLRRCAAALGMNPRALQIRLNDFGVTFSDLITEQRTRLAQEYILSGELTLDEVAAKLGYAEQTSFGRAFRRWTGHTPRNFKVRYHDTGATAPIAH